MGAVWVAGEAPGPRHGGRRGSSSSVTTRRTRRRARALLSCRPRPRLQVKSAHVVKIYDHGITDSGVPFIVMELLEGIDLGARLATEGKLSPAETLPIVSQLCKALERAHEKGVIHRDIKPANVFLATEGGDVFVKLLDFGIAKTGKVVGHRQPSP